MDVRDWPGDPETVWDDVDSATPPTPPRPEMPPWTSHEDFRRYVDVPRSYIVVGFGLAALGVLFIVMGWFASRGVDTGWESVAVNVVGAAMGLGGIALVLGGIALVVSSRRGWDKHLDTVHREALAGGIPVHAYSSPLYLHAGDGADPTTLLIDERVSDATAARLYAAAYTWLDRVTADPKVRNQTMDAVSPSTHVLPLAEVLGPEAEGSWIARGRIVNTPWALLIPDESADDGFGLESVIAVRDPERVETVADLFRLPRPRTVLDTLVAITLLICGGLAVAWLHQQAGQSNYWWDACADKFCAVSHDLRLMGMLLATIGLWLWGWFPIKALRRRDLRFVWALLILACVFATVALSAYLARVHPLE